MGGGAIILPGVRIGSRAVIGAGSVVTRDVPADVFAAGNPCRVIRQAQHDEVHLAPAEGEFVHAILLSNGLEVEIRFTGFDFAVLPSLEEVWGLHEDTDTRANDNFIVRLRRYIEDDPTRPRHLLTVRGVGYRFVAAPAAEGSTHQ